MTEFIGVAQDSAPSTIQPNDLGSKHNVTTTLAKTTAIPTRINHTPLLDSAATLGRVPTIIKITQMLPSKVVSNKPARAFSDNKAGMPVHNTMVTSQPN